MRLYEKNLLKLDPEKRILSAEALKHPFFKDLDEDKKKKNSEYTLILDLEEFLIHCLDLQ